MSGTFNCPQRYVQAGSTDLHDVWGTDDTCSYCGSLKPEVLLARLEASTAELGPTDKNYKVYVENRGGESFKQTYRIDKAHLSHDPAIRSDPANWEYETRSTDRTKFYFQHLSKEQQHQFIELLNANKVRLGHPGHFYNLPFFMQRKPAQQ